MKNTPQRLFIASISFSILLVLSISVVVDAYPSSQQLVLSPIGSISSNNDQASDDQLLTNQINRAGGHVSNWSAVLDGATDVSTIVINGDHYVAVAVDEGKGLQLLNITNPSNILVAANKITTRSGFLLDSVKSVETITVGDKHYAVVAGYNAAAALDITNPHFIPEYGLGKVELKYFKDTLLLQPTDVSLIDVDSDHYAVATSFGSGGIQILNVTNPKYIKPLGNLNDNDNLIMKGNKGVDTVTIGSNHYAVVASYIESGIQILDITNPKNIIPTDNISMKTHDEVLLKRLNDVSVVNIGTSYYALTAGYTGVMILDITDPYDIDVVSRITDNSTLTLKNSNHIHTFTLDLTHYAMISSDEGVQILDITDPANPIIVTNIVDDDSLILASPKGIDTVVIDTHMYAIISSFGDDGIQIFRISHVYDGTQQPNPVKVEPVENEPSLQLSEPPTANAGNDQAVARSSSVTLDGSGSSDSSNRSLTYSWEQTSGTDVTLTGADTATPTFTAPTTSEDLVFTLTVTAGGVSATDTVTVTVSQPPVANAGNDQRVAPSSSVSLDGSGSSDPDDGDTITYSWEQTPSGTITLTGATTATPTFTAPASGDVTFTLTVTAGGLTSTDTVTITVSAPPTANAGNDQAVALSSLVTLNGSGSDPENDSLTYSWATTSGGTGVTLSNAAIANPTFTAPSSARTIVFTLTVSDGPNSDTDTVTITVSAAPTADAGADKKVARSTTVSLDGSGSSDSSNRSLTYSWTQDSGTTVALDDSTIAIPTFTAPATSEDLIFTLTVTAGGVSATDTVTVTVSQPPVANAGNTQTVPTSSVVTLSGTGSDPDNDSISYSWEQTAGDSVTLSSTTVANPTFTAPGTSKTLTFTLTVSDGGLTTTDTVTITVSQPPTAEAGDDQRVAPSSTVSLDGSGSSDPDGDNLSYSWEKPSGSSVILSDSSVESPTFTAPATAGSLTFTLTVTAGGLSSTDDVIVTVSEPETFCNDMTLEQLMNPSLGYNVIDNRTGTIPGEKLIGTVGNDLILTSDDGDTINAKEGDDCIIGGSGDDIIRAGNGDDIIYGGLGNDILVGKKGNDTIYGGTGNDQIIGDQGNDTMYGQDGDDIIRGGTGDDIIRGGTGDDIIRGGTGDDIIHCGSDTDSVRDKSGSNTIAEDCETVPP